MTSSLHDALVKRTFSVPENAAGAIRSVLPDALAARIDWESLELEPGSFVDDEGRGRHTDLLFSALLDGQSARIYVLFEHQSTVDRWMPLRMLVYMTRIWTSLREDGQSRLPVILPLVVHHSETGWIAPRRLSELLCGGEALLEEARAYAPDYELVDDLIRVPETELAQRPMAAHAKLVMWVLRAVRVGFDPALVRIWAQALDEVLRAAGVEALELFQRDLSGVEGGPAIYEALLEAGVSEDANEVAMSRRKQWIEEGREEGRAEGWEAGRTKGRAEGRAEARAEVLLKLVQLKFGALPDSAEEKVRRASLEELDRWAERVLSAQSLEETLEIENT